MTKYGRPCSVVPPSRTLAMFGWSISASACRSASNRAKTCRLSIPALMSFRATSRLTGSRCSAIQTLPMPPSPISSSSLYLPATTVPTISQGVEAAAQVGVEAALAVEQGLPGRRVGQVEGGGEQLFDAARVGGHGGGLRGLSLIGAERPESVSRIPGILLKHPAANGHRLIWSVAELW